NTIQQILDRLDIIDVIGGFVKLKKRGSNYLGLCPFHNERTPSFTVSPAKELYKCFGCGKSGNTISFLMEHEKYSYVDTLRWLAHKYGVEVEETFQSDEQRQTQLAADSLYIINQFAQQYFSQQLFETEEGRDIGLTYFQERGFREDIIKKFQLGYSPEARDAFTKEALAKQYNAELLIKTGLVANRNEQLVDNYRGRVIFPVHNHSGKVLGFGARILKKNDKAPKYINSPENEIYIKSKILYGSYFARQAIDKANECLLVEGYTDVLSLHQAGIENVVASGGTSLTPDQLRLIKKYSSNLTIVYDGDAAGVKAALRGLDLALEEGLNVKLVLIPDGEDPDSYVNKVGPQSFKEFVEKHKKDFILFQLEVALKDAGNDTIKKSEVVNRIAETISRINKAEDFTKQQDYIKQCAEILKIDEAGMHALVNRFIRDRISSLERKLPVDETRKLEENAKKGEAADFDEATFNLLYKDELQEREVARILLEYGTRPWDENTMTANYILDEMPDETLIDNKDVLHFITIYKETLLTQPAVLKSNFFLYHADVKLSTLAVSLLNTPYEESERWKNEFSSSSGYQSKLFDKSYEDFMQIIDEKNNTTLISYLLLVQDNTREKVDSAIHYLKLRKVRRMLLENQLDFEKAKTPNQLQVLNQTHLHLKNMEIQLTRKMGTVLLK
ncbi:MAG TPA: DNA primase, partial [Chitinophagaceae bacterium]|nr:DNA primase [Chitinophagaceae bacterium]